VLSLIIALAGSAASFFALHAVWPDSTGWWITVSVLVFLGVWVLINMRINKQLERLFKEVQSTIMGAQEKIRREVTMYQQKGMVGPKIQEKVEGELKTAIRSAIAMLDAVQPLRKWNVLAGRQADTMKAQLLYQIKDYEAADPLLEKALAFDLIIYCMKMVRKFKNGKMDEVTKLFNVGLRRFRGEKRVILYATYSWILVHEERLDEAVAVLSEAKLKTDNPVLQENWEHLANGRAKRFSNAGLGDLWFSLNLEDPRQIRMRQQASPFGMQQRHFR